MDGELAITVRRERGVVIVAVTGEVDISTVTRLRERLSGLADGAQTLIVDLPGAVLRHCFGKLSLSGIRCSKPLRSR
jgi:riboflavin biosynthesis pyrimidine reductase